MIIPPGNKVVKGDGNFQAGDSLWLMHEAGISDKKKLLIYN
ncbi:hypothetical protein SAMN04488109_1834 [Chryseolinea serpens]|uniref:Uncharacterized protein n=1 Tax=Chryseolinea serpens TaxID=947013 RepID=A0A1M5MMV1_9BACT|nr:hypothetical protein SAMN04488109_1834 [Chryseolinea serpens]